MTKRVRWFTGAAVAMLAVLAVPLVAADKGAAPTPLDPLKALAGKWNGKTDDGKTAQVSYEVSGTVVVEKLQMGDEPAMVTVYHQDGDHLMMTHYCSMNNQPRMRSAAGSKDLDFQFVDATNMAKPTDPHMHELKVSFIDANHFTQVWVMRGGGTDTPHTFKFERAAAKSSK